MIDNTHCSVYLLCPSKGLAARKEQALADKLAEYKASLSEEEQEQLITATAELKQYQSEPSPKEILETIPLLTIDDIRREAEPIYNKVLSEEDIAILQHEIETNGIAYVDLLFDISHIAAEEVPYLGILTEVLGNMDTDHYTYQELTDEVNLYTGGLRTAVNIFTGSRAVILISHDLKCPAKSCTAKCQKKFNYLKIFYFIPILMMRSV